MSDAASPRVGPVKKALSVAVQYSCLKQADPMLELEGTHNDTLTVRSLLVGECGQPIFESVLILTRRHIDVYGYKEDDVLIIMDNESDHDHWPTRENIVRLLVIFFIVHSPAEGLALLSWLPCGGLSPVPSQETISYSTVSRDPVATAASPITSL